MYGGIYTGKVTVEWSAGYVNGSLDCWLVMDHDTGRYWRITTGKDDAVRAANRMAKGRPVIIK